MTKRNDTSSNGGSSSPASLSSAGAFAGCTDSGTDEAPDSETLPTFGADGGCAASRIGDEAVALSASAKAGDGGVGSDTTSSEAALEGRAEAGSSETNATGEGIGGNGWTVEAIGAPVASSIFSGATRDAERIKAARDCNNGSLEACTGRDVASAD